jgi:hypothetical protein
MLGVLSHKSPYYFLQKLSQLIIHNHLLIRQTNKITKKKNTDWWKQNNRERIKYSVEKFGRWIYSCDITGIRHLDFNVFCNGGILVLTSAKTHSNKCVFFRHWEQTAPFVCLGKNCRNLGRKDLHLTCDFQKRTGIFLGLLCKTKICNFWKHRFNSSYGNKAQPLKRCPIGFFSSQY